MNQQISNWQPISTAPTDNKRALYLARIDQDGQLLELDFNGAWERWVESWEMSHINGWDWVSANGIDEPTHWAYQDEPLPTQTPITRETRYVVLKLRDIDNYLGDNDMLALQDMCSKVAAGRSQDGKPPLDCVVVESDWPEYDPVWTMIENRMQLSQRES